MASEYRVERWSESSPPDADTLRRIMADEGFSVFQWTDQAGTSYGLHKHSTDQSHWIISGALELEVQQVGTVTLNPGDRDYMPAGTYHAARVIGDEPLVYLIGENFEEPQI